MAFVKSGSPEGGLKIEEPREGGDIRELDREQLPEDDSESEESEEES